jgi:hypothetical protein
MLLSLSLSPDTVIMPFGSLGAIHHGINLLALELVQRVYLKTNFWINGDENSDFLFLFFKTKIEAKLIITPVSSG